MAANGLFRMRPEKVVMYESLVTNGPGFAAAQQGLATACDVPVTEVTWTTNPSLIEMGDEIKSTNLAGAGWNPAHSGSGSYAPEITAKMRCRPKVLAYLLYLFTGGQPTYLAGTGSNADVNSVSMPVGVNQMKFAWKSGNVPQTTAISFAPVNGQGWIAWGCALSNLAFSFEENGSLVADVTFKSTYMSYQTLNITPDYTDATKPFLKGNFQLGSTTAPSFTSSTAKATEWNISLEQNMENFYSFGSPSLFPDAVEYADNWPKVGGSVTKRALTSTEYDAYVNGTIFACGPTASPTNFVSAIHNENVTGSTKYKLYLCMAACQFVGMSPEAITNKRIVGVSFDWEARTPVTGSDYCDFYLVSGLVDIFNPTAYTYTTGNP